MTLRLSSGAGSKKEGTEQLVEKYLKDVVSEMHCVDAVTRHFGKEPNRSVEEHVANVYMKNRPLKVADKTAALLAVREAERHYRGKIKKIPLRTRLHYMTGNVGKKKIEAAIVCGVSLAAGCVAVAHGADPAVVPAILAVAGGTLMAADYALYSLEPKKHGAEILRKKEVLANYTRAKQALFVLKAMEKQLTARGGQPKNKAADDDGFAFLMSKKGAVR